MKITRRALFGLLPAIPFLGKIKLPSKSKDISISAVSYFFPPTSIVTAYYNEPKRLRFVTHKFEYRVGDPVYFKYGSNFWFTGTIIKYEIRCPHLGLTEYSYTAEEMTVKELNANHRS